MSLYRKYRPQQFSDLIGEDHVRDTLLLAVLENRVGHGFLFSGPRGTGKTSVARLLAKAVNCQQRDELNAKKSGEPCGQCQSCTEISLNKNLDIIEIDAASNRGIDEIRELRDKVKFSPTGGKYKVFIIDEVHMLTLPAFNALLKTLEEPPKHAIFILATTEAHKIPATILSRVQRFDFRRIRKDDIVKNLKIIIGKEKIIASDDALEAVAVIADGSHRDSISLLEQIASVSGEINLADVENILGIAKFEEIIILLDLIASGEKVKALQIIENFTASGTEAVQIIREVIEVLRHLLLSKISGGEAIFDQTKERSDKLKLLAVKFETKDIADLLSRFIEAGQLVKESPVKTLPIEMVIIDSAAPEKREDKSEAKQNPEPKPQVQNQPQAAKEQTEDPTESESKIEAEKNVIPNVNVNEEPQKSKPMPQTDQTIIVEEKVAVEPVGQQSGDQAGKVVDDQAWKQILDKVKENNHTLNALLRDASPEGCFGNELVVGVKFKFHHDKISEVANRQIIEKIIEEVLGKKYLIKCKIKDKKPKELIVESKEDQKDPDLEKAAKEMFEVE